MIWADIKKPLKKLRSHAKFTAYSFFQMFCFVWGKTNGPKALENALAIGSDDETVWVQKAYGWMPKEASNRTRGIRFRDGEHDGDVQNCSEIRCGEPAT